MMYDLIGELNDVVRHELEHSKPINIRGYEFPEKEYKQDKRYYHTTTRDLKLKLLVSKERPNYKRDQLRKLFVNILKEEKLEKIE
jgi:hypothetical protein